MDEIADDKFVHLLTSVWERQVRAAAQIGLLEDGQAQHFLTPLATDSYLSVNKPVEEQAAKARGWRWMVEFGQKLRRERESRGIPVDAVCAITKVSARHVEALESGHLEALPNGIFRKGIVRSYLAAVGLDEAAWMEHYEASLRASGAATEADGAEWVEFAENVKRNRSAPGPRMGMRWLGVVLMFLALLVCGWLAWRYVIRERLPTGTGVLSRMPVPRSCFALSRAAG